MKEKKEKFHHIHKTLCLHSTVTLKVQYHHIYQHKKFYTYIFKILYNATEEK